MLVIVNGRFRKQIAGFFFFFFFSHKRVFKLSTGSQGQSTLREAGGSEREREGREREGGGRGRKREKERERERGRER